MTAARSISFRLNGAPVTADVKPHHNLVELLQAQFGSPYGLHLWKRSHRFRLYPEGTMAKAQLRHIAVSVPNKEETARFYEDTFGFKRVSESEVATRLTDGVMNLTFLQFRNQDDAGDERGKDFVGLHHFGLWVDNIDGTKQEIEANGGKFHPGPSGTPPANAEHKFRDPNGIVFDISTHGWDGAKR